MKVWLTFVKTDPSCMSGSLRGRRLKGKGKGVCAGHAGYMSGGTPFPSFTISPLSPVPTVRAGCTGVCSRHSQIFSHRSKAMETRAGNLRSAMFWRLSWPFTYEFSSCKQVVRSCFVQRECFKEHGKWFFQFRDSSGARSP